MSGIAGRLNHEAARTVDADALRRMCGALKHRGPDDQGILIRGAAGLGHRRLSVTDLSPAAHQPMSNEDGSVWIVLDGEISNYQELRGMLQLRGRAFHSKTDTEVVLRLYESRGTDCLHSLRGMFAFAIWDERRRTLFLARDRLGVKPLYYRAGEESLAFASELKGLLQDPDTRRDVDPVAIHHYLTFRYVPSPFSVFQGVAKLPPAHFLMCRDGKVELRRYWRLSYLPKHEARTPAQIEELAAELRARIEEAVRYRMVSDVPVGAFLSGGVDSSAVVACMSRLSRGPVKTFSIGFDANSYHELPAAGAIARHFQTEHTVFLVRQDVVELLPAIAKSYDEPFADAGAIPMLVLSRLARRQVKVALTGEGGDESFAGHDRYVAHWLAKRLGVVATLLGSRAARAMLEIVPRGADGGLRRRIERFAEHLGESPEARDAGWQSPFGPGEKAELYASEFARALPPVDSRELRFARYRESAAEDFMDAVLYADVTGYLPDCRMVRADIAGMAHGLEARCPFVDHRLMEFAARIPIGLKLRGRQTKWILRRALRGLVPREILRRRKAGFDPPLGAWLRGELKEIARELLLGERSRRRGYFRPESVERLLEEHLAGRGNREQEIWTLMMLELWHREFVDVVPSTPEMAVA
jgi:asparagine synthase (glutamine-hydrolysing)